MQRLVSKLSIVLVIAFSLPVSAATPRPAEARAWAESCRQTPPPVYEEAVGHLIERMEATGLWDKCGLLLFLAAHEASPGAFNLKGCPNGVLVGGTEHVPGRGLKGNGVDGWFDTRLHCQEIPHFTLERQGLYVYVADDVPGAFTAIGASGGQTNVAIRPRNLSNIGVYPSSGPQLQAGPVVTGVGLGGYSRFSATEGMWFKDKTGGPLALTPASWPQSTLRVLRHGLAGAFFPGGVSFVWAGDALEKEEAAQLREIFDECLAALGTLDSIRVPAAEAYKGAGAFKREQVADVQPPGMKIFALAAPPLTDTEDEKKYYYFPLHYAVSRPWAQKSSTATLVKGIELIWSDRALGAKAGEISDLPFKKGNDTSGVISLPSGKGTGRTEFDSYELAIGAMLGRTAYSAGLKPFGDARCVWEGKPMGWCDWLALWGYDVSTWRALAAKSPNVETDPIFTTDANEETGPGIMHRAWAAAHADEIFHQPSFTGGTIYAARNLVLLGPARSCDAPNFAGFIMDLEHADGRSPALFARSMEIWAHIVHCLKNPDGTNRFLASCTAHELDGGTGKLAGWDASESYRVYDALDYTSINLGAIEGRNIEDRIQAQLNVLRGPQGDQPVDLRKILVQVNLGMGGSQMKMADALAVHQWLVAHPTLGALFVAPVGANFKAPPTDIVHRLRAAIYGLPAP